MTWRTIGVAWILAADGVHPWRAGTKGQGTRDKGQRRQEKGRKGAREVGYPSIRMKLRMDGAGSVLVDQPLFWPRPAKGAAFFVQGLVGYCRRMMAAIWNAIEAGESAWGLPESSQLRLQP